jgi:hypothetical protein
MKVPTLAFAVTLALLIAGYFLFGEKLGVWPNRGNASDGNVPNAADKSSERKLPSKRSSRYYGTDEFSEPLDFIPELTEPVHGDLSAAGMEDLWKRMGTGAMPEYMTGTKGIYTAFEDEGLRANVEAIYQCNNLPELLILVDSTVEQWKQKWGGNPKFRFSNNRFNETGPPIPYLGHSFSRKRRIISCYNSYEPVIEFNCALICDLESGLVYLCYRTGTDEKYGRYNLDR